MLAQFFKETVQQQLRNAVKQNKASWLENAFVNFLLKAENNTDADYIKLVREIKEIIASNPIYMADQLGKTAYVFFNNCQFITDTKANPVDDMLEQIFNNNKSLSFSDEPLSITNHTKVVHNLYDNIKCSLNDIFSDMQPSPLCQRPVNKRITDIFEKLMQLRNVACKHPV